MRKYRNPCCALYVFDAYVFISCFTCMLHTDTICFYSVWFAFAVFEGLIFFLMLVNNGEIKKIRQTIN